MFYTNVILSDVHTCTAYSGCSYMHSLQWMFIPAQHTVDVHTCTAYSVCYNGDVLPRRSCQLCVTASVQSLWLLPRAKYISFVWHGSGGNWNFP